MGGLWVDYQLMSTIPGLFVIGEANFSDHGANRLGASALMQGLADGYFILPYTIGDYLASTKLEKVDRPITPSSSAKKRSRGDDQAAAGDQGQAHGDFVSSRAGQDCCGTTAACRATPSGLERAIGKIRELREEFWKNVDVLGSGEELNQALEHAGRVADFLELAELMCHRRAPAQ